MGGPNSQKKALARINMEEQSSIPIPYMLAQLEIFTSGVIYLCHFKFSLCFDR